MGLSPIKAIARRPTKKMLFLLMFTPFPKEINDLSTSGFRNVLLKASNLPSRHTCN
jgi:hypothetical protein